MSHKITFEKRIEIVECVTAGKQFYNQASEYFKLPYQQVRSRVLKSNKPVMLPLKMAVPKQSSRRND